MIRDEFGEKIMPEFAALRLKRYSYLIDDGDEKKRKKRHQKCVTKRKLKRENYKHGLEATQLENIINQLEKTINDIDSLYHK